MTRSGSNAARCSSATSDSRCRPISSSGPKPSNVAAALFAVRTRPSGAVTSTASLMLFNSVSG